MEFGKIEKVELREIWKHEAADFTPWLAENLEKLEDLIGIELELIEKEAEVGDFSLDILAKDIGRNRNVIIENQLEATNHDHLGKLITYASFHKAEVIIWISKTIREEHRSAIDWLNLNTNDNLEFFAVEVEVIRIDSSKPALNFKLKAFPNEWQKSTASRHIDDSESDTMTAYKDFFQNLIDDLRNKHKFTNAKAAQPMGYYFFSTGVRGFKYAVSFAKNERVRVEINIDTGNTQINKDIFTKLEADKVKIESSFQETLEWELLPNKRASRVAIYKNGSINEDSQKLEEIKEWCIKEVLKMKEIFGPKLNTLVRRKNETIENN